ncbi:MAG: hypothetical protein J1F23_06440 [Oscillospiraceae bacterium]|nr:hypothetical protein [Oscillospiraceae bacterium]
MDSKKIHIHKLISVVLALTFVLMCFTLGGCKSKTGDQTNADPEISTDDFQDVFAPDEDPKTEETDPSESESTQTTEPQGAEPSEQQSTAAPTTTKAAGTTASGGKHDSTTTTEAAKPEVTGTKTLTSGNKTVVYPKALETSSKRYPVIVWANGTGCPTSTYMSLLEKFANAGYVVVADSSVMTADGTSQRNSIDFIIKEAGNSSSVFYSKIDTQKVGASGHSQGGRSCVNAAQADSRIKCIVSIAGASSADEAKGLKAPTLYLTGTSDMVVVSSQWVKPSYDATVGRAVYASLKGAVHTTCMTNPEKLSDYCISWFDAYLKNDSTAMAVFADGGKLATDSNWQDFASKN